MAYSRTTKASILALGSFLAAIAGMASGAVITRVLTKDDYATYKQTLLAYSFAAPFLALGLPQALFYFLPGNENRSRSILMSNLILLAVMGFVFSLFLLLGGNHLLAWRFNNQSLTLSLLILVPYPLFMLPSSALDACLVARGRVKTLAAYQSANCLGLTACVVTAGLVWRTPNAALTAAVAWGVIAIAVAVKLMLSACPEGPLRPERSQMLAQVKYSVPLGMAGMLGTATMLLDKIVVSSMCKPAEFAVYTNGAIELPLVGIVTYSVTAVLVPEMAQLCKQGNFAEALGMWKRSAVKCALVLFPAMCLLMVMAPQFIVTLWGQPYAQSVTPFRFYLLMLPVRIVFYGAALMAAGRGDVILTRTAIGLALNLLLSILCVHLLHSYLGAIVALIITMYGFAVVYNLVFIGKTYKTKFRHTLPFGELGKVMLISIAACAVLLPQFLIAWPQGALWLVVQLAVFFPLYGATVALLFSAFRFVSISEIIDRARRIRLREA